MEGQSQESSNSVMMRRSQRPPHVTENAKLAVMGGAQAAKVLLQIEASRLKGSGKELSDKELKELKKNIEDRYERQMSPYYAASRLWVDAVIDPAKTREWLSYGLEMANNNPEMKRYNPGVIQT